MFSGVYTAIVTPFDEKGRVDCDSLKRMIEFQIQNGVAGIVPCGTTGEAPTLNSKEQKKVIKTSVRQAKGRVKVIAGTGANCTEKTVKLTKMAKKLGADAALIVNPYYNKPTQEGLYRHFKTVADSADIPIVIYNIKSRTGVNVETATLMRLIKDCRNIVAVKEASGDLLQIKDVIKQAPAGFDVLSGDDNMTLSCIRSGGKGIISVASNIVPDKIVKMVNAALNKDKEAEKLNKELSGLFKMIFIETNPIPIKAMLAQKGMCKELYRLPICELMPENKEKLIRLMEEMRL